jgi:hypothetical protein
LKEELGLEDESVLDMMLQVILLSFYIKNGKYLSNKEEFLRLRTLLLRKFLKGIVKKSADTDPVLSENLKQILISDKCKKGVKFGGSLKCVEIGCEEDFVAFDLKSGF